MISLNVGPSHISEAVRRDIEEINESGLLAESHRGPVVQELLRRAVETLRTAMGIPADYLILFQPSASAAMELTLRNCVASSSFHFVNGAFSRRFAKTAERIGLSAARHETAWDAPCAPADAAPPADAELITVTHAETSTGRMWPRAEIGSLRERYPGPLLAVDATSTFGALVMDWTRADVWLGSVQKCLGLPAGLGYAVLGPRALDRAESLGDARGVASWQDLLVMRKRIEVGETVETPNVLAIALLERQAARMELSRIEAETRAKGALLTEVFGDESFYVREPAWRSRTVHCLKAASPDDWKARAIEAGGVIGSGYGPLKESCVRIATFPAVDIAVLEPILRAVAGAPV